MTPDEAAAEASRRLQRLQTIDESRVVYGAMPWWHPVHWVMLAWLGWYRRSIWPWPTCMTNRHDPTTLPARRALLAGSSIWVSWAGG